MRILLILLSFFLSLSANAVENCHAQDDVSQLTHKTKLTRNEAQKIVLSYLEIKNITIPDDWCQLIDTKMVNGHIIWRFAYTGSQLDVCFWLEIDDQSEKVDFQYCA